MFYNRDRLLLARVKRAYYLIMKYIVMKYIVILIEFVITGAILLKSWTLRNIIQSMMLFS